MFTRIFFCARARGMMARAVMVGVCTLATGTAARADDRPANPPSEPAPVKALAVLEKVWPDHPEWLAMFVDILNGSDLDANDGWFRKAVAHSRYDWKGASARFDHDGDGQISRSEICVSDDDFNRLDRNGDGILTAPDFDFSAHALTPSPGMMMFRMADRDGNGKLTREELDAFFDRADTGHLGFLSLGDAQDAFTPPPMTPAMMAAAMQQEPSRLTLLKGLITQEIGSLQAGPSVGERAPDFTLKAIGGDSVTLSSQIGPKPVVLIFGNFTCGPFRSQAGNVEKLYRRYKDRATFLMVYVREAHPTDGWSMSSNDRVGVALRQPRTFAERLSVAQTCTQRLDFGFPVLVDALDDRVGAGYSGMPSRLYVIDRQGTIAFKNGRGPFGFKPRELEQSLILVLSESAQETTAQAAK